MNVTSKCLRVSELTRQFDMYIFYNQSILLTDYYLVQRATDLL